MEDVPALVKSLMDPACPDRAAVVQRLGIALWHPRTAEEEAWLCIGRDRYEDCAALGAAGIAPLAAMLGQEDAHNRARHALMKRCEAFRAEGGTPQDFRDKVLTLLPAPIALEMLGWMGWTPQDAGERAALTALPPTPEVAKLLVASRWKAETDAERTFGRTFAALLPRSDALAVLSASGWRPQTDHQRALAFVAGGELQKAFDLGPAAADALVQATLSEKASGQLAEIPPVLARFGDLRAVPGLVGLVGSEKTGEAVELLGSLLEGHAARVATDDLIKMKSLGATVRAQIHWDFGETEYKDFDFRPVLALANAELKRRGSA